MSLVTANPPDLLRRFVEAPIWVRTVLHSIPLTVETNDPVLAAMFPTLSVTLGTRTVACVLIVDDEVPECDVAQIIGNGVLKVVILPEGAQLHADSERRSIAGFLRPAAREAVCAELSKELATWMRP